jgi:ABC-type cobalt transport system substrate-binding protein
METSHRKIWQNEKLLVGLLLLALTGYFIYLALASAGVYGGADVYCHYFISAYAFRHPPLFVDHWGKPLFTVLSAPFSQMGFFGLQLFNILLSFLSAWLAYRVCKTLELKFSWLSILLVIFAPMYFVLIFSGLTETLFGFVLILAVFLFFRKKYWLSALIISFLPFARTEGLVIIPLFAVALILHKKWIPILFLLFGFLLFSVAGYFHYHDFFWFFTQSPYKGALDIYGKGSLWHFVSYYREIFGLGFTSLIVAGIVAYFQPVLLKRKIAALPLDEILLILLPAVLYFAAHSYVWWKGMDSSAGLTRVIAGIIPLTAVIGIKGINLFLPLINRQKIVFALIGILLFGYIIYEPFKFYPMPLQAGPEEQVLDKVAFWMKKQQLCDNKVFCGNAYLFFKTGSDPYDSHKVFYSFPPASDLVTGTEPGDVMVWDAHFTPNEGHLDLASLMDNKFFALKAFFQPAQTFTTLGGRPYEVYVFQRTQDSAQISNAVILQDIIGKKFNRTQIFCNAFAKTKTYLPGEDSNSCFIITPTIEYSPAMEIPYKNLNLHGENKFEMSVDMFPIANSTHSTIDFVTSVSTEKKVFSYQSFTIITDSLKKDCWNTLKYNFTLPEITDGASLFKAYIWNNKKTSVYVDNLVVSVIKDKQEY